MRLMSNSSTSSTLLGHLRQFAKLAAVAGVMIVPAACSVERSEDTGSGLTYDRNMAQLQSMSPAGGQFNAELTKHYKTMAERQAGWREDYIDADYFARKGIKAASGDAVFPEEASYWDLTSDEVARVNAERQKLMDMLDGGARRNNPVAAAAAQARFDCWVEALEPGERAEDAQNCFNAYQTLAGKLHTALMRPQPQAAPPMTRTVAGPTVPQGPQRYLYMILFDFDDTMLSDEARIKLREVALTQRKWPSGRILVVGHADSSGSKEYNVALSQRRATAVINALVDAGADPSRITATWSGENNPAVQRPDGKREPANRRVMVVVDEAGRF